MSRNFRFNIARLALLCLVAAGLSAHAGEARYSTDQVADGVYLFSSGEHRSLFLVGDEGVIVTDPINATVAAAYREAIADVTSLPVKYVAYSHYHWDRIAGGEVFRKAGAKFVAQEKCTERLRIYPNPDVVMPDISFADRMELDVGNMRLGLHYFGPAHGDCLTVFLVEPAGLLQVVEMVNPPRAAFPADRNVPHIKPHNLRQFFQSVESLAADRGVTAVLSSVVRPEANSLTGPPTLIAEQAGFWNEIYRTVETAEAAGNVDLDSFVKLDTIDLEPYRGYLGYEPTDLPIIMRRFVGYYDMGR